MRTEYLPLHTAINYFEDFKDETVATILKITANTYLRRVPSQIANFLIYIIHDDIPLNLGLGKINGISLYGKNKESKDEMVKICLKDKECNWLYSPYRTIDYSKTYYTLKCNYDYKSRYVNDFNYSVLTKNDNEILYTDLSIKYDEFLNLMQELNEYIKQCLEDIISHED